MTSSYDIPKHMERKRLDSYDALLFEHDALAEAMERIRDELQQANGGKGPNLPLSIYVLGIACSALAQINA